jgi:hypothetical protein
MYYTVVSTKELISKGVKMDIKQPSGNTAPTTGHHTTPKSKSKKNSLHRFMKISAITLLFSGTILVVALLLIIVFGNKGSSEGEFVDTSKHQAVFMNGGQVYFGKITELNKSYMTLQDIYYLQVNQHVQPEQGEEQQQNDVTLVKLGCELHGPQDLMVIKQDQVIFWENLKEDGKVAQAVKQFQSQNPNGLQCEDGQATTDPQE